MGLTLRLTLVLSALALLGAGNDADAADPTRACDAAAARAERAWDVPPGILSAVGTVESGRGGGPLGVAPWPWTINAAGRGSFYASKEDAIAAVFAQMAHGIPTIDIGCFQIDILYHPGVFRSLDEAFDPDRNATEAAKLLMQERQRGADWPTAVAHYHSANPTQGAPYLQRVRAAYPSARTRGQSQLVALEESPEPPRPGLPRIIYGLPLPPGARAPQILHIGARPAASAEAPRSRE